MRKRWRSFNSSAQPGTIQKDWPFPGAHAGKGEETGKFRDHQKLSCEVGYGANRFRSAYFCAGNPQGTQ